MSEAERHVRTIRSYRYRLAPTEAQSEALEQIAGACRFIYNIALEQREHWWRQYRANTGHSISYIGQTYELTELRAQVDWIGALPRDSQEAALKQLDGAFKAFLSGRARYPRYRRRDKGCGFTQRGPSARIAPLNAKWATIRLSGVGDVKFRLTRPPGIPKTVSVRKERDAWFASVVCEITSDRETPSAEVGVDRGVTTTLALSTGELWQMPPSILEHRGRRQKAQRVLARRKKGSARRGKQKARVAALWARERRARADWLHRASTDIASRFGLVAVEALDVRAMTASAAGTVAAPGKNVAQKRGLNRAILHQSWGQFERQLEYKLEAAGGTLIRVPAAYSSQTCQACGTVDARSRESQAVFRCVHCGHVAHADTNAALEILRRSTSAQLVEGARQRPCEARTVGVAA